MKECAQRTKLELACKREKDKHTDREQEISNESYE